MSIDLYDRDTKPFTIEQFSYDLYDFMTSRKMGRISITKMKKNFIPESEKVRWKRDSPRIRACLKN